MLLSLQKRLRRSFMGKSDNQRSLQLVEHEIEAFVFLISWIVSLKGLRIVDKKVSKREEEGDL